MGFTQDNFAQATQASADVVADYARWGQLLAKWNARINLVASSSLAGFWERHAYDSWQITPHIKDMTETLLDLGSGAGFPALAAAIEMKSRGRGHVYCVESAGKKVNFMRTVIRELSLPATVMAKRAEEISFNNIDCITARAFAPLPRLLSYAHSFWGPKTYGLFLKGQGLADEIRSAQDDWIFSHQSTPSLSDETGFVVNISQLKRREEGKI